MKKEYIKPEILVEEILLEGMLAQSEIDIPGNPGPGIPLSNERQSDRGTWGNLWGED